MDRYQTPPSVVGAVAAGVAPAPFLLVYAVLFLAHGTVFRSETPDITGSFAGEAVAGVVALALLVLVAVGLARLLGGRGRWVFLAGQLITLGGAIDFLVDPSAGEPGVPALLVATSAVALVLACLPPSWAWASADARRP